MYTVDIEKRCGCVKKDNTIDLPKTYKDKKEAEFEALKLANYMNANYCKKHRFYVNEEGNNFIICVELSCPHIS
jgi:hypothetical protein